MIPTVRLTITCTRLRNSVQWLFFAWIMYLGIQFGLFVRHFTSGGQTPFYPRPPGVEGFLPIGALTSLRHWLASGNFDTVHPAALVLFVTFLAMSLLTKKSFCSWLCPVGTLSELLWKLGQRLAGRNFTMWSWLDVILRSAKYLLLGFFIKLLLLDMPTFTLGRFLQSPYWKMSDVKMLHFFTHISATSATVITVLVVLSLVYKNFWCRYLCPYGALLGLISMASPLKISRDSARCVGCGQCSAACPSLLPVAEKTVIRSPECTGCLSCVNSCANAAVAMALYRRPVPPWLFAVLVLGVYTLGIATGMLSGHWHTSLTYADYRQLIPQLNMF